jgi:hypothetical protein
MFMTEEKEPYNPFEKTDEEDENFWNYLYPDNGEDFFSDEENAWFEVFEDGGLK